MSLDRRRFLEAAISTGAIAASGWSAAQAAPPQTAAVTVTALSANLHLIAGAGGNVVALSGPEGLLLVDSGSAEHSPALLQTLASFGGSRAPNTVLNTHWHPDHTGGNEALRRAGAHIIAHENTRLWMGTEIRETWQDRIYKPRPKEAWPTETFFYKTCQMSFAGEPIEYGYLPQAHTDGDLYVYFRGQNVLVTGDVLSVGSYPILDYSTGGWIVGMENATAKLLTLADAATRIIPGTGPVQTRQDLQAEHDMLSAVHTEMWKMMRDSLSARDMVAARPTAPYDARWGDPQLFIMNAYEGMYGHIAEYLGKGVV